MQKGWLAQGICFTLPNRIFFYIDVFVPINISHRKFHCQGDKGNNLAISLCLPVTGLTNPSQDSPKRHPSSLFLARPLNGGENRSLALVLSQYHCCPPPRGSSFPDVLLVHGLPLPPAPLPVAPCQPVHWPTAPCPLSTRHQLPGAGQEQLRGQQQLPHRGQEQSGHRYHGQQ